MASSKAINDLTYKAQPFYRKPKSINEQAAAPVNKINELLMFLGATYVPKGTGIIDPRVEALHKKYEGKASSQIDLNLQEAKLVMEVSKAREELSWEGEWD